MGMNFLVVCCCLLMTAQASETPSANTTVSKVQQENKTSKGNIIILPNYKSLDENETFSGYSPSKANPVNITGFKANDEDKTVSEGNVTLPEMPFFFNPEENITFSANSSLLKKPRYSLSLRSKTERIRKKFIISEFKASWLKAMQFCRSRDMQLITINCKSDQKVLKNLLKDNRVKTPVWTSGSDNGGEKRFYWISSGDKVKYKKWRRGQPDGMERGDRLGTDHCLQVSPEDDYEWSDFTCFTKQLFVCEMDE